MILLTQDVARLDALDVVQIQLHIYIQSMSGRASARRTMPLIILQAPSEGERARERRRSITFSENRRSLARTLVRADKFL